MHRTLGRQSEQAYGITATILEKMLSITSNNLRGIRDRTLLLIAYDSLCRRSELVCLKISGINTCSENHEYHMTIRLRRSKTDQKLQGRGIFLSKRSADAIALWMHQANLKDGYLFRVINNAIEITGDLKGTQINRIYKRLAKEAGLPKELINRISGHSMRVGAAQDLLSTGASIPMIMNRGRWSKTDTVMRYLENSNTVLWGNKSSNLFKKYRNKKSYITHKSLSSDSRAEKCIHSYQ